MLGHVTRLGAETGAGQVDGQAGHVGTGDVLRDETRGVDTRCSQESVGGGGREEGQVVAGQGLGGQLVVNKDPLAGVLPHSDRRPPR